MMTPQLNDRERTIFEALVDLYVRDATPVSSAALHSELGVGLSSATIRNVLHGLEEKGLLQQPHKSAGRAPTVDGYRLYVDLCCKPVQLPEAWVQRIFNEVQAANEVSDILGRVSKLLATMSNNVGVGLALAVEPVAHVQRVELVGMEGNRAMVVVTLDNGVVRTEPLTLERGVQQPVLEAAGQLLNEIVCDRTPAAARQHLERALMERVGTGSNVAQQVARQKDRVFADWPHPTLHVQGASEIMGQPEFTDPANLRNLVRILDHPESLESVLVEQVRGDATSITIGGESRREELSPFSLVMAPCNIAGFPGFVGILGPMRMRYSLALSLVTRVAQSIRDAPDSQ
jgi:heat-inducible transcriptional repressor